MKTWKHLNIEQRKADANLINSRRGIDLDDEEFNKLDSIIKKGIDENKSIFQIKIENKDEINLSLLSIDILIMGI